jgi:peptide/nickel transport system substrate-binding protein
VRSPVLFRRRRLAATGTALATAAVLLLAGCGGGGTAAAGSSQPGVLTIGMTAGDIPNLDTLLSVGQGYEGIRFVGNQLYDGLTRFDLKQGTATPKVIGGLASSWESNPSATEWTFHLRGGVTFHDGTAFDAQSVLFNLDRYLKKDSPYFSAALSAYAGQQLGGISHYSAPDASTVRLTLSAPQAALPSSLTTVFMASPTAVRAYGNNGFGQHPVGTGPFMFDSMVRGQQLVLKANPRYWGGPPKLTKLVLRPLADAATRTAALRSGEVNWIEYPNPTDVASLRSAGYQLETNSYDHVWPWVFDQKVKPWDNRLVRQAVQFAIDRDTMAKTLLAGTAEPAYQLAPRANAAYRPANDVYHYDPAKAKRLLAQAGYPNGFTATVVYPTSGSGNMNPGPMNQELQSDLAKVGVTIKLQPVEWATMLSSFGTGKIPMGASAVNISLTFLVESSWYLYFGCQSPINVAHYCDSQVDQLLGGAAAQTDETKRADAYAQAVKVIDGDAVWLDVVNDRNPRVLAPDVHGFVEPKSWFVDLTTVSVGGAAQG